MKMEVNLESIGRLRKLRRESPEAYKEFLKDLTEILLDLEKADVEVNKQMEIFMKKSLNPKELK